MSSSRRFAGRSIVLTGICGALLSLLASGIAMAADPFPFDRELLLDAVHMKPGKRLPMLTVAPDGSASIDLWCKTVSAHVELFDTGLKIEPGPLPEALPEMMANGQCTPARMQADQDLLDTLAQVTGWSNQGSALVLQGPKILKFRPATN